MKTIIKKLSGEIILSSDKYNLRDTLLNYLTTSSDLSYFDLSNFDLSNEDLRSVNLKNANLTGADLTGANLIKSNIPIYCKLSISIIDNKYIKIGYKQKTIQEWDEWFSGEEEYETSRNTKEFKMIYAMYSAYKSYLNIITQ